MHGARTKRLALFMPRQSAFYISLLFFMKKAFERRGYQVIAMTELLQEAALMEFCRQYNPHIIMEMNRSRQQVPFLPKSIKHIAWVVDTMGHDLIQYQKSEIIYFFGAYWIKGHENLSQALVDWLPPGACSETYTYGEQRVVSDFSFAGHIPESWSDNLLNRIVHRWENGTLLFGDLFERCIQRWKNEPDFCKLNNHYDIAMDIIEELSGDRITIEDKNLIYDVSCRSVRLFNRKWLMDLVLSVSHSLRIFGPETWLSHPEYVPYYQKFITNPQELRQVYQSSKINLHEGVGSHFRTYDCLSSGGCLFFHESLYDDEIGGINTFLEPGVDFVPFRESTFGALADFYLNDEVARRKIGKCAAQKIKKYHTWDCRVDKILKDLERV